MKLIKREYAVVLKFSNNILGKTAYNSNDQNCCNIQIHLFICVHLASLASVHLNRSKGMLQNQYVKGQKICAKVG